MSDRIAMELLLKELQLATLKVALRRIDETKVIKEPGVIDDFTAGFGAGLHTAGTVIQTLINEIEGETHV